MLKLKKTRSEPVAAADAKNGPARPSRRRMLHGGLAAGPVLMTLVSRPVLGAVQCVTPSAFCSGNASVLGADQLCEGRTPDYWLDNPNWPAPYTQDTPFNDVFGSNPPYECQTLADVLSPPDAGLPDPTPDPPSSGGKHHLKDSNTHSHSPFSRDDEPREHSPRAPGTFHRSPSAFDASSPFSAKKLQVSTSDDPAVRHYPLSGQRTPTSGDGEHSRQHGLKHKGPGQQPEPDPVPSDPVPVDPLGCNDHTATAPDPSPDPGTPPSPPGRRKNKHRAGGLRAPTDHDAVARHVVAALLNAQAGYTPAVSAQVVKGIWHEYTSKGYFEPTAGVQWGSQEILTYLSSIQPV